MRMRKSMIATIVVALFVAFGFSGCACKNSGVVHETTVQYTLYDATAKMAKELLNYELKSSNKCKPIILTSFINVDNFEQSSNFGRLYSETLLTELSKRACKVIDFRGRGKISVSSDGEFFLTRKAKMLTPEIEDSYIVVGTYSLYDKGIIVNARAIDYVTGEVISSSNVQIYDEDLMDKIYNNGCEKLPCLKSYKKSIIITKVKEDDCRIGKKCK